MQTLVNWFSQILSVTKFSIGSIPQRGGASIASAIGIAGVVAVLVGVLAIAEGFRRAMTQSGSPDTAIVLRSGADSEMTSSLTREDVRVIGDAPGVAHVGSGPLASAELFVMANLAKRSTGTDANVPIRGVETAAVDVRSQFHIEQGRRFESGRNEVMVGVGAAREFAGMDLGGELKAGPNTWKIVGIFSTGGGVAESEIWTDAAVLQPTYHRNDSYQSVYVKLTSPEAYTEFKDALTSNPQLEVKVSRSSEYYAEQSTALTGFITTIGVFIAGMMALGALFGALNTMYSAVATRTREIATLRALGFGAGPVVVSVMAESLVLALIGGTVGALAAYLAFDGYQAATLNWQTFSQVTFGFKVTPGLLVQAMIWACVLGFLGGLFPALRAVRMPIAVGLRES